MKSFANMEVDEEEVETKSVKEMTMLSTKRTFEMFAAHRLECPPVDEARRGHPVDLLLSNPMSCPIL